MYFLHNYENLIIFSPSLSVVINVTLPDDKQNYIHRIGRVGRADRMGLAISLVATVKEKVCPCVTMATNILPYQVCQHFTYMKN